MNIQFLGFGSLLHSFTNDQQERRQYPRVRLEFPLWWLKDLRGSEPVPGLGTEMSGGGLQFLMQHEIGSQCSLAFQINDRHMRANVDVLESTNVVFEEEPWQRYRAKFVGLVEADFDFIIGLATGHAMEPEDHALHAVQHPALGHAAWPKISIGSLESYDALPLRLREMIVQKLVEMQRLKLPQDLELAPLSARYGGGIKQPDHDNIYHRFLIRTWVKSAARNLVFNTEVLLSDDGSEVQIR